MTSHAGSILKVRIEPIGDQFWRVVTVQTEPSNLSAADAEAITKNLRGTF